MAREKIKHPLYLTPQEVCYYQQVVEGLAKEGVSEAYLRQEYRDYAPDKPLGRTICESYPIQDLVAILTERAKELGRTPTQQDIFPLYRAYLGYPLAILLGNESLCHAKTAAGDSFGESLYQLGGGCLQGLAIQPGGGYRLPGDLIFPGP